MKKSYKMILSLYIVFVMALSFNGVLCHAESVPNPINFELEWSQSSILPNANRTITYSYSCLCKRSGIRAVFITNKEFINAFKQYKGYDQTGESIYGMILTNDYRTSYCSLGYSEGISSGPFDYAPPSPELIDVPFIGQQFQGYGLSDYFGGFYIRSVNNVNDSLNNLEGYNATARWITETIPSVSSVEDAYKYLMQNDNSVVNNENTQEDIKVINNHSLPVPQEVEVYKDSENPALVWANPVISGNKTVYVDIEWLPTIDCINGRSVISTLKPSDYVQCCYEKLDGHNAFVTQQFETSRVSNDLMGYDYITDSKPLYSLDRMSWFSELNRNTSLQFVETPLMYIIGEDKFNSFNIRGLNYRIRYVFGTENDGVWRSEEVSDWIYSDRRYGYDNKSPSPHSTTSRYNSSGDPVDNTNYRPNSDPNIINISSDVNESWWVKFNNDTLSVFNIFTQNIDKEQASMIDNNEDSSVGRSDSIFKLVAGFFKEFPIFMVFLISGFAVVVFLRIFGR